MTREELKTIPVAAVQSAVPRYLKFLRTTLAAATVLGTLPLVYWFVLPAQDCPGLIGAVKG